MRLNPSPKTIRNINGAFSLVWLALVIPTVTVWNKSILWVGFLSVWANFISHYTAYLAGRVEVREEQVQIAEGHQGVEQDEMLQLLKRIIDEAENKR